MAWPQDFDHIGAFVPRGRNPLGGSTDNFLKPGRYRARYKGEENDEIVTVKWIRGGDFAAIYREGHKEYTRLKDFVTFDPVPVPGVEGAE